MALQARHLYLAHHIDEGLGINNNAMTEELIRQPQVIDQINRFFSAKGPPCLYFYYISPEEASHQGWNVTRPVGKKWRLGRTSDRGAAREDDQKRSMPRHQQQSAAGTMVTSAAGKQGSGSASDSPSRSPLRRQIPSAGLEAGGGGVGCLVIHDGKNRPPFTDHPLYVPSQNNPWPRARFSHYEPRANHIYLPTYTTQDHLLMYLRKTIHGQELNPAITNDGLISFGVINGALWTLDATMRYLFFALVKEQTAKEWGKTTSEEKRELMVGMEVLNQHLQAALKASRSTTSTSTFRLPGPHLIDRHHPHGRPSPLSPDQILQLIHLLAEWSDVIERSYLNEEQERLAWETLDSGPDTEIGFWKRRVDRLRGVREGHVDGAECRSVVGRLEAVGRRAKGGLGVERREEVMEVVERWKVMVDRLEDALCEARDNSKYLSTLDRFMLPLYSPDPMQVLECLPGLMNAIKIIYTVSKYFNTRQRMTTLLKKVTNQMVASCLLALNGRDPSEKLWQHTELSTLISIFEACLRLNETYQAIYQQTKERLSSMLTSSRQYDFDEGEIFGRFDLFSRRVIKLLELLTTMRQYLELSQRRLIDGRGGEMLLRKFDEAVKDLKEKGHDLLEYQNEGFERDYAVFNTSLLALDTDLQAVIDASFGRSCSITDSLNLLSTYHQLLTRPTLRRALDARFLSTYQQYGKELSKVQKIYEAYREAPPIGRNVGPVAGGIICARQLLKRIEEPMKSFRPYPAFTDLPDSKRMVKTYNKVAKTLVAFELLWYDAWCKSLEAVCAGLHATLLITDPDKPHRYFVNFDQELRQVIHEAKYLSRLPGGTSTTTTNSSKSSLSTSSTSSSSLPPQAEMLLLQEDRYKKLTTNLKYLTFEFEKMVYKRMYPILRPLLAPAIKQFELCLKPALVTLTWTSVKVDTFVMNMNAGLRRFEGLVDRTREIMDQRIFKHLKRLTKMVVVDLSLERTVSLEEFVVMQEQAVREGTSVLIDTTKEVEAAVNELLALIRAYPVDSSVPGLLQEDEKSFRKHFHALMQMAIVCCIKRSLLALRRRICRSSSLSTSGAAKEGDRSKDKGKRQRDKLGKQQQQQQRQKISTSSFFQAVPSSQEEEEGQQQQRPPPFFVLHVQLSIPSVRLSPSLDDVQSAINRAAAAILATTKQVHEWEKPIPMTSLPLPSSSTSTTAATSWLNSSSSNNSSPDRKMKENKKTCFLSPGAASFSPNKHQKRGRSKTFFDVIGDDLGIIRTCLLLTGALHGTTNQITTYLKTFHKYDWLWKDDKEAEYQKFLARHSQRPDLEAYELRVRRFKALEEEIDDISTLPTRPPSYHTTPDLEAYDLELRRFKSLEEEIETIPTLAVIPGGTISLMTTNLKIQLKTEVRQWIWQYASKVLSEAEGRVKMIMGYVGTMTKRLGQEIKSLQDLREMMMGVLKDIRERDAVWELDTGPILEYYYLLDRYLPTSAAAGGSGSSSSSSSSSTTTTSKAMMITDQREVLLQAWAKLLEHAEDVQYRIRASHAPFYRKKLLEDLKDFSVEVRSFREEFDGAVGLLKGAKEVEAEMGEGATGKAARRMSQLDQQQGKKVVPERDALQPMQAVDRLRQLKEDLAVKERKHESYKMGEDLFGFGLTQYPDLVRTKQEIGPLDRVYGLYVDVVETTEAYHKLSWSQLPNHLKPMRATAEAFEQRCQHLPPSVKQWPIYATLYEKIAHLQQGYLPLFERLVRPSLKPRHLQEIMSTLRVTYLPYEDFDQFTLGNLMSTSSFLRQKVKILQICEAADRQQEIRDQLMEVVGHWARTAFAFSSSSSPSASSYAAIMDTDKERTAIDDERGGLPSSPCIPLLLNHQGILENLEDSQISLQSLLGLRHVTPFRKEILAKLTELSETSDILELWIKVQGMWSSVEMVYHSLHKAEGDEEAEEEEDTDGGRRRNRASRRGYAALPEEAVRRFNRIEGEWGQIMMAAQETGLVVPACAKEILHHTLPVLYFELQHCQEALGIYLEGIRRAFARFYFISDTTLLSTLSQTSSNPDAMQAYYSKVFGGFNEVGYGSRSTTDGNSSGSNMHVITHLKSVWRNEEEIEIETLPLVKEVQTYNKRPEQWLPLLEQAMQESIKSQCAQVAYDCLEQSLPELLSHHCTQTALVGLYMKWTLQVQEALEACQSSTSSDVMMRIYDYQQRLLLQVLSSASSTEERASSDGSQSVAGSSGGSTTSQAKRDAVLTMLIHQRDVCAELRTLHDEGKLQQEAVKDFEWLKHLRVYWRPFGGGGDKASSCVIISIYDTELSYGDEYLGPAAAGKGLVITPLTERCYLSLSQALGAGLGSALIGPSTTGKTETARSLGHASGYLVFVTNCTPQLTDLDLARTLKGMCGSGVWTIWENVNHLTLNTLSVFAQHLLLINNARKYKETRVLFPGDNDDDNGAVVLNPGFAYFTTICSDSPSANPMKKRGLPENFRVLFRSTVMLSPDVEVILRVKLCMMGYQKAERLAQKCVVLLRLCETQLTKQLHYDFGLRQILSVLKKVNQVKQQTDQKKEEEEERLFATTLRDMILCQLIPQDVSVLTSLVHEVFGPSFNIDGEASPHSASNTSEDRLEAAIAEAGLLSHPGWSKKLLHLHKMMSTRNANMLIGSAGTGKSSMIQILQKYASSSATRSGGRCKTIWINPKAVSVGQLFGEMNRETGQWEEGIFAAIWDKMNSHDHEKEGHHWLILDGPIEASWIEHLHTVLDADCNLVNGERVARQRRKKEQVVKLIFETDDLVHASPAVVSRVGVVYVSETDLGWQPLVEAWIRSQPSKYSDILRKIVHKYIGESIYYQKPQEDEEEIVKSFEDKVEVAQATEQASTSPEEPQKYSGSTFGFVSEQCKTAVSLSPTHLTSSFIALMSQWLARANNKSTPIKTDGSGGSSNSSSIGLSDSPSDLADELERIFLFCLTWSFGGILATQEDRVRFDNHLRSLSTNLIPPATITEESSEITSTTTTIYDYLFNVETLDWELWQPGKWSSSLSSSARLSLPPLDKEASLLVPTVDTCQALFLMKILQEQGNGHRSVLLTGADGVGKSATVLMYLDSFASSMHHHSKRASCSSATTASMVQRLIEGELRKRAGKHYAPSGGARGNLTVFLDDVNMPAKDLHGHQPACEVVRQLIERNELCFLEVEKRGNIKTIENVRYIALMRSSNRMVPSSRVLRHFFPINLLMPSNQSINSIYNQFLLGHFPASEYPGRPGSPSLFLPIVRHIPTVTLQLWCWLRGQMHPSPTTLHYVYNLHDLDRVMEGLMSIPKDILKGDGLRLIKLWRHQCEHAFGDKLTSASDKQALMNELKDQTAVLLQPLVHDIKSKKGPTSEAAVARLIEGANSEAFLIIDEGGCELAHSLDQVKQHAQTYLEKQGNPASLVLFDDALHRLVRITRCLGRAGGHLLLIGEEGCGRRTLVRLAAYMMGQTLREPSSPYHLQHFEFEIKAAFRNCCGLGKAAEDSSNRAVVLLVNEAEMKEDAFLGIIHSIVTTGEVPDIFTEDEIFVLLAELRPLVATRQGGGPLFTIDRRSLLEYFYDCVRSRLHILMCMSPTSPTFHQRLCSFPGLLTKCAIDWYQPWSQEALVAVGEHTLGRLLRSMDDNEADGANNKSQLLEHMARTHQLMVEAADRYYSKYRQLRITYTPRSYLSYLKGFCALHQEKNADLEQRRHKLSSALTNLQRGREDVERMKEALMEEDIKLRQADDASTTTLKGLELWSMEAKKEGDRVSKIKASCEGGALRIEREKKEADAELAKALPFIEEAEAALQSTKPNDLQDLKNMTKPSDIIKLIFDCVGILRMEKMGKVEKVDVTLGAGKDKASVAFIKDSFKSLQAGMISDTRFMQSLLFFTRYERDMINAETVELLMPYLELEGFRADVAHYQSKAAESLWTWCRSLVMYHGASKKVRPKLEALKIAQARLDLAQIELFKAEKEYEASQEVLAKLQTEFESQMIRKRVLEETAVGAKRRVQKVNLFMDGLMHEKTRWNEEVAHMVERKQSLHVDLAVASALVHYCGAFRHSYRQYLIQEVITKDLNDRGLSLSFHGNDDLDANLVRLLVNEDITTDFATEGLPTDDPSALQSASILTIVVNESSSCISKNGSTYPLLIDPQGQALQWLKSHEAKRLGRTIPTNGSSSNDQEELKVHLQQCLEKGRTLIINEIDHGPLDPLLYPVLERQIVERGKSKYILIDDHLREYKESFRLYLITRRSDLHLSAEDQRRVSLIDFSMSQQAVEQELLTRVIAKEHKGLAEQIRLVSSQVYAHKKSFLRFEEALLDKLCGMHGNMLDDETLIQSLTVTRARANDASENLTMAEDQHQGLQQQAEQYRPVACRGGVLYFAMQDMCALNPMCQTSLPQLRQLFDRSIDMAQRANLPTKRVNNIVQSLTYLVYRYVDRYLYEKDKIAFKLVLLLKILVTAGKIAEDDVQLLLGKKAISSSSAEVMIDQPPKPFEWLSDTAWKNILRLSRSHVEVCKNLVEELTKAGHNKGLWRVWYEESQPERMPIPTYEATLAIDRNGAGPFLRLLLVCAFREDRTWMAVHDFIRSMAYVERPADSISTGSLNSNSNVIVAALGPRYTEAVTGESMEKLIAETSALTPVLFFLSPDGGSPLWLLEDLAKSISVIKLLSIGMHQEVTCDGGGLFRQRDIETMQVIKAAMKKGHWLLLENGHLNLSFMSSIEHLLHASPSSSLNPQFRLFITTDCCADFPLGLLHSSIKVSMESPRGLRTNLLRSYTNIIDQARLQHQHAIPTYRKLLYALTYTHAIIACRRDYESAMGWSSISQQELLSEMDLKVAIDCLAKQLTSLQLGQPIVWSTLHHMIGEIIYGGGSGKVIDSVDRRLLLNYLQAWLSPAVLQSGFVFAARHADSKEIDGSSPSSTFTYRAPDYPAPQDYQAFLREFPDVDSAHVVGLPSNADKMLRRTKAACLFKNVLATLSRDVLDAEKETAERIAKELCEELLKSLPEDYQEDLYMQQIALLEGGLDSPLNAFLIQEIRLLQKILSQVRETLTTVLQAITGDIIATSEILSDIKSLSSDTLSQHWVHRETKITSTTESLRQWYDALLLKDQQLRSWLQEGKRPVSFNLAHFFDAKSFLCALQREAVLRHQRSKKGQQQERKKQINAEDEEEEGKEDGRWAIESMILSCEVTSFASIEEAVAATRGNDEDHTSVFLHGLRIQGAGWNREGQCLEKAAATKEMQTCSPFPLLRLTVQPATTERQGKQLQLSSTSSCPPPVSYECPVYQALPRRDTNLLLMMPLGVGQTVASPSHWIMRGVALFFSPQQPS